MYCIHYQCNYFLLPTQTKIHEKGVSEGVDTDNKVMVMRISPDCVSRFTEIFSASSPFPRVKTILTSSMGLLYELNELTQVKQVNQCLATQYVSCHVTVTAMATTVLRALQRWSSSDSASHKRKQSPGLQRTNTYPQPPSSLME